MVKVAIIDYGAGNLFSVRASLARTLPDEAIFFVQNPEELASATHIILPGVGAFADCIDALKACKGMIAELEAQVFNHNKPFLGICVGMQMLFEYGNEHGKHAGLGWLKGEVVALENTQNNNIRIPHMGWNELDILGKNPLLTGINSGDDVYFVHSFHCLAEREDVIATTNYGGEIVAAITHNNIAGVQFHPEKSHQIGQKIIANFVSIAL